MAQWIVRLRPPKVGGREVETDATVTVDTEALARSYAERMQAQGCEIIEVKEAG